MQPGQTDVDSGWRVLAALPKDTKLALSLLTEEGRTPSVKDSHMKQSTATITTQAAGQYIGKLCRHFRHKIETEYTPTTGLATFPFGTCNMTATPVELIFDITAQDTESVEKIKGVLERHLVKFAYKENLTIDWRDGDGRG